MSNIAWEKVLAFNVIIPSSTEDGTGKSLFKATEAMKMPDLVERLQKSKMSVLDAEGGGSEEDAPVTHFQCLLVAIPTCFKLWTILIISF